MKLTATIRVNNPVWVTKKSQARHNPIALYYPKNKLDGKLQPLRKGETPITIVVKRDVPNKQVISRLTREFATG
jgi:hypothetical protein